MGGCSSSSQVDPREKARVLAILATKQKVPGCRDLAKIRNVDCFYVKRQKASWKMYFVMFSDGRVLRYEAHPSNWAKVLPSSERKKRVSEKKFIARYIELEQAYLKASLDELKGVITAKIHAKKIKKDLLLRMGKTGVTVPASQKHKLLEKSDKRRETKTFWKRRQNAFKRLDVEAKEPEEAKEPGSDTE